MNETMKNEMTKETSQEKAIKLVQRSMSKWEARQERWQEYKIVKFAGITQAEDEYISDYYSDGEGGDIRCRD